MNHSDYARRYCEMGLALVPVPPGQKGPRAPGWQRPESAIRDPNEAARVWAQRPTSGMACVLLHSRLVSLDIDDLALARHVLGGLGVDLDALRAATPTIVGRPDRCRLLFRAPDADLRHRNVRWPEAGQPPRYRVIVEFRAGPVADMLPPALHPVTGQPYRWERKPVGGRFPDLPGTLVELWRNWDQTEARIRAMSPGARVEPPRAAPKGRAREDSVIDEFNRVHDLDDILLPHGYTKHGNRYRPRETTHAAGLVRLGDHVYCHHASDPLGDGRRHDAFGVWARLKFGGDVRSAVRAAAVLLGMTRQK